MPDGEFIEFPFATQDLDYTLIARLYVPARRNAGTGLTTLVHGWGCNRYQFDHLASFCEMMNLFGLQLEYRGSGYESRNGYYDIPYEFGKLQVIDTLRAVQETLQRYPEIDQRRLFLIGGSGGGHNVLQAMAFAPNTFAATVALAPGSRLTNRQDVETGGYPGDPKPISGATYGFDFALGWGFEGRALGEDRHFSPDEWDIRNCQRPEHVAAVRCPVMLLHSIADETVDTRHSIDMAAALIGAGKRVSLHIVDCGADDGSAPNHVHSATSRPTTAYPVGGLLEQYAGELLREQHTDGHTDFLRREIVTLGRWQISYAAGIPELIAP